MAEKLCKEQQISSSNSAKYYDFIDGKCILLNWGLKGPFCSKKIASSKKFADIFYNKYARGISGKSLEQKGRTSASAVLCKVSQPSL